MKRIAIIFVILIIFVSISGCIVSERKIIDNQEDENTENIDNQENQEIVSYNKNPPSLPEE